MYGVSKRPFLAEKRACRYFVRSPIVRGGFSEVIFASWLGARFVLGWSWVGASGYQMMATFLLLCDRRQMDEHVLVSYLAFVAATFTAQFFQ